jgi:hypothetical protein
MKRYNDKKKIENFANLTSGDITAIVFAVIAVIIIVVLGVWIFKNKKDFTGLTLSGMFKKADPVTALLDSATSSAVPYVLTNTL